MAEFDFAIVGTNMLSGLLAGVLARDHGKRIVRVGAPRSAQRLPRSLDLPLPLATRPASWRILREAEADTRDLLGSLGVPEALGRTEAAISADLPDTAAALDHMAHLALSYGHQVRRLPKGWAFRRISLIDAAALDARLGEWLKVAGVTSLDAGPADAAITILADDAAIFEHLPEAQRPAPLVSQAMTSTLLVVPRPLPCAMQYFPDRGVALLQRPGQTALALVSGETEIEARLASVLAGPFPVKRLATTRYRRFVTSDGAPLIGRLKPSRQFVIAGLGDAAAFFAPALARFVAGASNADERRWFAAHDPAQPRDAIAEFISSAQMP